LVAAIPVAPEKPPTPTKADMIIDAHQHFWDHDVNPQDWIDGSMAPLDKDRMPADLKPDLDDAGIDATVLVQASHSRAETDQYLAIADEHPWVAGVVGWTDLTADNLGDHLDRLKMHPKFVGLRHVVQGEPDENWIVRDDVLRGLDALEDRGLTYDLLFFPKHLRHTPTLAGRFPGLKLVIDHLAKPPIKASAAGNPTGVAAWRDDLKAAAEHANVYCKLSGLVTEADHEHWKPADLRLFVAHAVECFGPERLMYGSDWPVCQLAGGYTRQLDALREVLPAGLSPADEASIFGGTAARFYGLADPRE